MKESVQVNNLFHIIDIEQSIAYKAVSCCWDLKSTPHFGEDKLCSDNYMKATLALHGD